MRAWFFYIGIMRRPPPVDARKMPLLILWSPRLAARLTARPLRRCRQQGANHGAVQCRYTRLSGCHHGCIFWQRKSAPLFGWKQVPVKEPAPDHDAGNVCRCEFAGLLYIAHRWWLIYLDFGSTHVCSNFRLGVWADGIVTSKGLDCASMATLGWRIDVSFLCFF